MGVFFFIVDQIVRTPASIYPCMKITEKQLRKIIRESISEVNGALNEKFHELALLIVDRYNALKDKHKPGKDWSFLIPKSEFSNYNVYNLPYSNVRVFVSYADNGFFGACWNNYVYLYPNSFEGMEDHLIPFLEHELTHMVQGEGSKKYIGFRDSGDQSANYDNNYTFTPFEMSARISQAYRLCQQELEKYLTEAYFMDLDNVGEASFRDFYNTMWNCLNDKDMFTFTLDECLHLTEMAGIISAVKNDTYENFINSFSEGSDAESVIAGFVLDIPYYLEGLMKFKNWKDRREFEQIKLYVVSNLERLYTDFRKKINKTLAPLAMQYFEKGMKEYA